MGQPLLFQLKDQVSTITFKRQKEPMPSTWIWPGAMGEVASKLPGCAYGHLICPAALGS